MIKMMQNHWSQACLAILSFLPAIIFAVCYMAVSTAQVQAAKGDLSLFYEAGQDSKVAAPLKITLGKAELIDVQGAVTDVLVADPSIIDVIAVQANRLYIVGQSIGDTNIIALDNEGNVVRRMDVHVTYDLQAIQSVVDDVFPTESVQISAVHDQIMLMGDVSNPEVASKITNLVGQYVGDVQNQVGSSDELISNLLNVRGEQQVMLQVRIVEAAQNLSRSLGVNLTSTGGQGGAVGIITPGAAIGLAETAASFNFLTDSGAGDIGTLDFQLDALEEDGVANILAEPNLTAVSGEEAGFLAGGEFPVPSGLDNTGNLVVTFRDFGVSLNFRPVVLSNDRISLKLETEVSSLDFDNAVNLGTVDVPGLDVRRADTTVELPSGASLMIAGLLQSDSLENLTGLPGINDVPILGDLLSSDSFQRNETELIIIVTPYIVNPFGNEDAAEPSAEQSIGHNNKPLAQIFAQNITQAFDDLNNNIFGEAGAFGYIID